MIADVIKTILVNWLILLIAIVTVRTVVRVRHERMSRRPFNMAAIIWSELLFWVYGFGAIYTGVLHAYFGAMVATTIGWAPSPFQFELGWIEIGVGATALLAASRNYSFRLAATIPYAIFSLAAAAQHIRLMVVEHNYSPGNAGIVLWLGDIVVPLAMILLAWMSRDD